MAANPMPVKPLRVMTLKGKHDDLNDKYLIVSSIDSTILLEISENNISSVEENIGFVVTEPTIHVALLEDGSYLQVTPKGIVHIRQHLEKKNTKWQSDRPIRQACSN